MLQAILSRIHYNLMHPQTPTEVKPLIEEQFRQQRDRAKNQEQEWQMIEHVKCPGCGKVYNLVSWTAAAHCRQCGRELVNRDVQMTVKELLGHFAENQQK